jgi:hypothetical protein
MDITYEFNKQYLIIYKKLFVSATNINKKGLDFSRPSFSSLSKD